MAGNSVAHVQWPASVLCGLRAAAGALCSCGVMRMGVMCKAPLRWASGDHEAGGTVCCHFPRGRGKHMAWQRGPALGRMMSPYCTVWPCFNVSRARIH